MHIGNAQRAGFHDSSWEPGPLPLFAGARGTAPVRSLRPPGTIRRCRPTRRCG